MFRLLITAPEYEPQFVTRVDPTKGLVKVTLKKQNLAGLGPRNKLIGTVLNPQGKPIEGAKVEFDWIRDAKGGCGGVCDEWGVQPLAVTDSKGSFLLTARREFDTMAITVEARALAKRKFSQLASGTPHRLQLTDGTAVTGRVVRDNRQMPHVTVGLVSVDRSDNFTGEYEIATDDEGRFAFPNIPPNQKYFVYTRMSDARAHGGVASVKEFTASSDETTTSVGDLIIRPAYQVSGRVRLADGKPIPAGTRMWLGREEAWDALGNVDVPADGSFRLEGVPREIITLGVRVKGYRLSAQNPGLDRLNPFRLIGRMETNLQDFVILLEPGGEFGSNYFKDRSQPKNTPLRGIPGE